MTDLDAVKASADLLAIVSADLGHWYAVKDGDPRARALFRRHYSCRAEQRRPLLRGNSERFTGPSEHLVLLSSDCLALFAWTKRLHRADDETGINCSVFRNEGPILSSILIREACDLAWVRWPGERLFTFVDPTKIRSTNPGACFKKAGWRDTGRRTLRGLVTLECLP